MASLTFTNKSPQASAMKNIMSSSRVKISDSAKKAIAQKPLSYYENTPTVTRPTNPLAQTAPKPVTPSVTPTQTRASTIANAQGQLQNIQQGVNQLRTQEQQTQKNNQTTTQNNQNTGTGFGGIISQLQGASKPSNTQTGLIEQLRTQALKNQQIADQAKQYSEQYGQQIAEVGRLGAGAVAGNMSTGSNIVGSGNAAIASQSASSRMSALADAQKAALEGTGQQLTGQQQTTDALNQALGGANVQQSATLGGLSSAGGLAQPVQVAPGSTLVTPTAGEQVAGGLGGYVNYNTAEQVMGLISQYPDAGYSYNQNLTPQQNLALAQQAIQSSPTYQKSTFGAPGASSYLGGAGLQSAADLTSQVSNIQAVAGGAEANFDLLLNIAERGGVNNLNQPALNQLANNLQRGLASDADVASFQSVLQSVRAQYATILGGGTPTDQARQEAMSVIPETISLSALQTLRGNLQAEIQNRVAGYQNQIQSLSGSQGGGGFAETW